jgi:hypothetical protein
VQTELPHRVQAYAVGRTRLLIDWIERCRLDVAGSGMQGRYASNVGCRDYVMHVNVSLVTCGVGLLFVRNI